MEVSPLRLHLQTLQVRFAENDSDSCPWAGWTGKAVVHDWNLGTPGMKAWERNCNKWVRLPPRAAAKVGHLMATSCILKEGLKNERALDFASHRPRRLLLDSGALERERLGRCLDSGTRLCGGSWRRCNRPFQGGFMAAVGEVKWVYVHNGSKFVWLQVRVKHVGKTGLALVDFLDGSGSSLFPVEGLFDENGY